ncbi:hypothetical protein, partial [Thiolapillus sp.]
TVNLLAINIVILPLLIWMVFRDGDRERATILHQLMDEPVGIVAEEEKPGLETQRRYHHRHIDKSINGRQIVWAQNELAFRKQQLQDRGIPSDKDPISASLRKEILNLRR